MLIGYKIITCGGENCGITYAVPEVWYNQKRNDHTGFYCPNGCSRVFKGESDEDKLRRENQRLVQKRAELEDDIRDRDQKLENERKRSTAFKGHVTRIKNRVAAGVCPCCNRSFSNLARHMHTKHSGYKKEAVTA